MSTPHSPVMNSSRLSIARPTSRHAARSATRGHSGGLCYLVRAVDAAGRYADTLTAKA